MKNFLKVKRWELGIKQYELAKLLNCSAPYLSLIENGRLEAPPEFQEKAANILKLDKETLFPKLSYTKAS